jgi:hypothetical protein
MGSKTQQSITKREYGVALRNKHVETCVMGSLALYLFQRFSKQPFPSFEKSENWFRTPLFTASKGSSKISYQSHNEAITQLLKTAEVTTTKVTQIGRGAGLGFLGILF